MRDKLKLISKQIMTIATNEDIGAETRIEAITDMLENKVVDEACRQGYQERETQIIKGNEAVH